MWQIKIYVKENGFYVGWNIWFCLQFSKLKLIFACLYVFKNLISKSIINSYFCFIFYFYKRYNGYMNHFRDLPNSFRLI